ncbi:MAG: type II CRISPR RNA-guided endonuclease Cas9 [Sphingomonas fennica]
MRRLGLDIGTNSIGWCLIEDDARIVDIGVRIFSDGRDPKSKASLAVARRDARAMRRRRDRYLGRRSAFLSALVEHGLMLADADEAKLLADRDPYDLRKRALTERLEPYEIGRALFHLNQRRGFKSNRKADRKSTEKPGVVEQGGDALTRAMAEAGAETLGAFLADQPVKRVRMDGEAQGYDFYPQRRHVEHEFACIWEAQASHHPALLTGAARAALHRILFFQRPLKEVSAGFCLFAGRGGVPADETRLPKAHPLFQQRRLYEEVNQLEITSPGEPNRKLTRDQRDALILKLSRQRDAAFGALAKTLKLQPGESFNKASETRDKLLGDVVYATMADKKRFGTDWAHLCIERQWQIVERVQEEEDPERLHAFLTQDCGLDDEHARATAAAPLPEGHGRLGETATRRILDELKRDVVTYAKAVELAGWHHSDERTGEVLDRLPYYGELLSREIPPGSFDPADREASPEAYWGRITNPTVHIGLRQLEKLVNAIIDRHGRPDEIVVELARELKLNDEQREEHNKRIRKDTAAAIARGTKLAQEGIADTGRNRALLRQWEELNPANPLDRRCPYCAQPIGMHQLFAGEADIDHIIPYSRSLDDSASNKVVAHRHCNRAKGNRTPYEKWGQDADRWETISAQVARLHKSRQWRFGPDAMARVQKDGGFLARQLTDTQYLSRLAGKYLRSLYPTKEEGSVYVVPGRMTAMLRRTWGLNELLPDHNYADNPHSNAPKNRLDHRHHAIDAAVIAVTTRGLLQSIARAAARAEELEKGRLTEDVEMPWAAFRSELGERLMATTVSHKPDHGRTAQPPRTRDQTAGRLHNDTAYGFTGEMARDGKTPIVVHRVSLASLKPGDLTDPERIPDPTLRDALFRATRDRTGPAFTKALRDFAREDGPFKGLRHLRVREALNVIPVRDAAGRAYKGYKGDANARFDIWRMPDGKWVSDIVSMFDAHQADAAPRRPHPAARRLMTLRQNDLLAIDRDGDAARIVRVVKFSGNGQIALAADNEAGALKARDAAPNDVDPFKYILSSASGLKKARARPVRVDPLGRVAFDPGPRD